MKATLIVPFKTKALTPGQDGKDLYFSIDDMCCCCCM
jgi:hypothetical protein